MRPVASTGTSRVTRADMMLGGYLIPKNSFIVVPFDAVHHFPGNWPHQPHAFIPVRLFPSSSKLLLKLPCSGAHWRAKHTPSVCIGVI